MNGSNVNPTPSPWIAVLIKHDGSRLPISYYRPGRKFEGIQVQASSHFAPVGHRVAFIGPDCIDDHSRKIVSSEAVANALRITAAPEMYAALKAISAAGTLNDQSVIDKMRAAIAKAEGHVE